MDDILVKEKSKKKEESSFSLPESLSQSIARFLENEIIEGKMKAGMRLVPDDLAESLKVSKSPVREALLNLQKEGLVTNIPRVGFFVADISLKDIEEIYPIRAALISLMIRMIIDTGYDPGFLKTVDAHLEKMKKCVNQADLKGYYSNNVKLYNSFLDYCPNRRLVSMILQLGKQVLRFRMLGMTPPGRIDRSCELNLSLIEAIKRKDGPGVANLIEQIIHEGLNALRNILESNKE